MLSPLFLCNVSALRSTMTINEIYDYYLTCTGVSIDSRTVQEGDLFIGISGPNYDGDHYAEAALAKGAKYAVVRNSEITGPQILHSPLGGKATLTQLAIKKRSTLTVPVIALTGSNGKTTTKELLHRVLATTFKTYATTGNLNNHLGVPLTILRSPADIEILVVEMGANHQKEIAHLASIARPTIGLITNIGKAHLEGFGGEEGVYIGKKELYDYIAKNHGVAFVNGDDDKVVKAGQQVDNRVSYTLTDTFSELGISENNTITYSVEDSQIWTTLLTGRYNASNMAAAIAIGKYFDITDSLIHDAICSYHPTNSRSQLIRRKDSIIIMDAYNANPDSMLASLANLVSFSTELPKQAILGEMLELGKASKSEHQRIIDQCHSDVIQATLVGPAWKACDTGGLTWKETVDAVDSDILSGSCTLLKGSRGVKLERLLS